MRVVWLSPVLWALAVSACAPSIPRSDAGRRPDAGLVVPHNDSRCGDGTCQPTELALCALDCHCGDGLCDSRTETTGNCEPDCPALPGCGDGVCDRAAGETAYLCPRDCEAICSDGFCDESGSETASSCAIDCGCGDGTCDPGFEDAIRCPADCEPECGDAYCDPRGEDTGSCADDCHCGNGICDDGESDAGCPEDCYPLACGDGECDTDEDYLGCPYDCPYVGSCGDGVCDDTEDIASCAGDCPIEPGCGDGVCSDGEIPLTCSDDCSIGPSCGDLTCSGVETVETCGIDCAPLGTCGDTVCDPATESLTDCTVDCFLAHCSDGVCDPMELEDETTCPADCGPESCGDGECDTDTEDEVNCEEDCSSDPSCGDDVCDDGESHLGCPEDCAFCGDGTCAAAETPESCDLDCGEHRALPRTLGGCARTTHVVVYAPWGAWAVAEAIRMPYERAECVDFWVSVPPVGNHQIPRFIGTSLRHPRLHPMAEFNFGAHGGGRCCSAAKPCPTDFRGDRNHVASECLMPAGPGSTCEVGRCVPPAGSSWSEIGRHFRVEMGRRAGLPSVVGAPTPRDDYHGWAINETNSRTPGDAMDTGSPTRQALMDLVRGLHEGPDASESDDMQGVLFVFNRGHDITIGDYRRRLQRWLQNDAFWSAMQGRVRFVAQESYVDPRAVCESSPHGRAGNITRFAMHVPHQIEAAPASAGIDVARGYLRMSYTPLMNAVWGSAGAYGHTCGTEADTRCVFSPESGRAPQTNLTETMMRRMIAEQARAIRLWDARHPSYAAHVGFAIGTHLPRVSSTRLARIRRGLAAQTVRSIRDAYVGPGACHVDGFCRFSYRCEAPNPNNWASFLSWR